MSTQRTNAQGRSLVECIQPDLIIGLDRWRNPLSLEVVHPMKSRHWYLEQRLTESPSALLLSQPLFQKFAAVCETLGQFLTVPFSPPGLDLACDVVLVEECPGSGVFGSRIEPTHEGGYVIMIPVTRLTTVSLISDFLLKSDTWQRELNKSEAEHVHSIAAAKRDYLGRDMLNTAEGLTCEEHAMQLVETEACRRWGANEKALFRATVINEMVDELQSFAKQIQDSSAQLNVRTPSEIYTDAERLVQEAHLREDDSPEMDGPWRDMVFWKHVPQDERIAISELLISAAAGTNSRASQGPGPRAPVLLMSFLFALCHEYWHAVDGHLSGVDGRPRPVRSVECKAGLELLADWYSTHLLFSHFLTRISADDTELSNATFKGMYFAVAVGFAVMTLNEQSDLENDCGDTLTDHPSAILRWALVDELFKEQNAEWRSSARDELLARISAVAKEQQWPSFAALGDVLVQAEHLATARRDLMTTAHEVMEQVAQLMFRDHETRVVQSATYETHNEYERAIQAHAKRLSDLILTFSLTTEEREYVDQEILHYAGGPPLAAGDAIPDSANSYLWFVRERIKRTAVLIHVALLVEAVRET